jgi:Xaa-Pro dipeptidase
VSTSELELGVMTLPEPTEADTPGASRFDRVSRTADDRPSPSQDSLPALIDPAADHLAEDLAARRADVDEKHRRVIEFLDQNGYGAAVLTRAESLAWFTSGGELGRCMTGEVGAIALYVNHRCRAVICDNVQSARVFEEEVAGLGFQLKERPWNGDPFRTVADLARGKSLASDGAWPTPGLVPETTKLRALRFPLTKRERQRLRELGRTLTQAIEATSRNFQPGETEADVAGHLAHRLLREGVVPVDLRVAGDDRMARYRRPSFKAAPIQRRAAISAVGRRFGLCAAATRTVSFGRIDHEFHAAHGLAAMVDATYIYFSRPGAPVAEVFAKARRIYEKFGHPDEWALDYQGSIIAYRPCEVPLQPEETLPLRHGMPVCWSPSVDSARSEDTVVVDERGFEVVTDAQRWPKLEILVKGFPVQRPGILQR